MKNSGIAVILAGVALLPGCASIITGQNQSLPVETRHKGSPVSGASCKFNNDKGTWYATTPGTVTVSRSYEELSIRCEKDKYDPGLAVAKSSTKGMMFGNILLGGIIGAAVDAGSGAGYDYPSLITVEMGGSVTIEAPQPEGGEQAEAPQAQAQ